MQKIILPLLIILTISPMMGLAQQTKINLKKGQQYRVETSTKMTSSSEAMGQTMESNIESAITNLYEILGTGNKTTDLQSTITRLVVASTALGQEIKYDSDKKDNDGPLAGMLSNMINKAKNITIDAKGKISSQDEDNGTGLSGIAVSNPFTTELFIPALIGKKLKAGESFTDITTNSKDKYNRRDSGTYMINSIDDGVALISYSGTQVVSNVMEQMGMEMTSTSNNKVVGVIHMDIKTGLVLVNASVTDSNISIEAGGMTIPSTGKTTTTITIKQVQ